jgi:hypothetical protein
MPLLLGSGLLRAISMLVSSFSLMEPILISLGCFLRLSYSSRFASSILSLNSA